MERGVDDADSPALALESRVVELVYAHDAKHFRGYVGARISGRLDGFGVYYLYGVLGNYHVLFDAENMGPCIGAAVFYLFLG